MYTGWHLIDGKWYYFSEGMKQPQGAMLQTRLHRMDMKLVRTGHGLVNKMQNSLNGFAEMNS